MSGNIPFTFISTLHIHKQLARHSISTDIVGLSLIGCLKKMSSEVTRNQVLFENIELHADAKNSILIRLNNIKTDLFVI